MYRVMIVDDEEPVLDSFAFIFSKYVSDFTLCGKARSGTEAVRLIRELNPDLVFMDIQMPGVDGIEAIRQIQPLFPHTVFILATAYERFDIAQKAIHLGVFSYLVKPVSRQKILEELKQVKKHLDERKKISESQEEEEEFLEKRKEEFKRDFLSSLIWKNPDKDKWEEFCRLFDVNSERSAIYLVGGIPGASMDLRQDIYNEISRKIRYKYKCHTADLGDKLLLLFPEEREMKDLEKRFREILSAYESYHIILGAGDFRTFNQLSDSFALAFEPFSDENGENNGRNREQKRIHKVYREILTAERAIGENLFKEYWIEVFKNYTFDIAKGKMVGLFTLILQNMDNHLLIRSNFNIDPAEEIIPLENMEDWRKWASVAAKELFDLLDKQRSQSYPKPLKKALSYIAENYSSQIQLTAVADECLVSPSYLSRLFSEHLDTKFIDYVNRFRINQAVILLRDRKLSIKEASYMVGYQDPNYFSRIFRKIMGVSPSDLEKRGSL
ncbi:response regulator transcription factor [Spirochaeta isovalerica]|uniref:Two-component system response regulator YesN n=1 Tax=Spirochaeta isovalerica TaxID=150 RepID=A0A841RDV7_9SPIO|nr:response regulator [Spirochaeta isovalerica]MBB6481806.1 two-component system response regulator YesN [Spirochaeta isovalerica]